jgi:hypothetical protein
MSQQALKILSATDPPRRLLIDDDTIREVAAICPALLARVQVPGAGRDKFAIGVMASFNRIYIAFEQTGCAEVLRDITDDMMAETDALLDTAPKELDYVFQQLPLIMDLMEESERESQKSEALGGIVLTYVTVARHLIDSSVSAVAEDVIGIEEEEDLPPVGTSPILDPTDGSMEDLQAVEPAAAYSPDIKDVLKNLVGAGVKMNEINLKPQIVKQPKGPDIIVFTIEGPLPKLEFNTIARINAMFMKATGRGIALSSEAPVNFTFQV